MKLPPGEMVAGFCHITDGATQPRAVVREFSANGLPVTSHPAAAMWSLPSCAYQEHFGL